MGGPAVAVGVPPDSVPVSSDVNVCPVNSNSDRSVVQGSDQSAVSTGLVDSWRLGIIS